MASGKEITGRLKEYYFGRFVENKKKSNEMEAKIEKVNMSDDNYPENRNSSCVAVLQI